MQQSREDHSTFESGIRRFRRLLRRLERLLDGQLRDNILCGGISLVQCHTLMEIEAKETTNLKVLADSLGLDKSTVSRTIDGLVQLGLVEREIDSRNRRSVMLGLTEEGRSRCLKLNRLCDDYYNMLLKMIPENKREMVLEGLALFIDALHNINKDEAVACCRFEPDLSDVSADNTKNIGRLGNEGD